MSHTIRHDSIALIPGADAAEFERFITAELMPHFAVRFKGPTRSSNADLKAQSLLRDSKSARKFVLVTEWDGAAPSVAGAGFENARMSNVAQTGELLKKLETYGKRSAEKVYSEIAQSEVGTNV